MQNQIPSKSIPIEDDPCDVIAKAMRGLSISTEQLAQTTGLDIAVIKRLLAGELDHIGLMQVGQALELNSRALANLPDYQANILPPSGLYQIVSPFGHAGVNAYLIEHGHTATVIDTGTNPSGIIQLAKDRNLDISKILITHQHADHNAGLDQFPNTPVIFPENLIHGETINTEGGKITAFDVSGHCTPAYAYYYSGLSVPICIVGDSIFAGSMGGTSGTKAYISALRTAQEHVMSLPPETIICPGHGPLTCVEMESTNNPFFKQCFKSGSHLP